VIGVREHGLYRLMGKHMDHGKKQEDQVQVPKKQVQVQASEGQVQVPEKVVHVLEAQRE